MLPQKLKAKAKPVKKFSKGSKSKTMKGKEDFTSKLGNKDFNRGGKREKTAEGSTVKRRPFQKKK